MRKKLSIGLAAALSLGIAGYAGAADYPEPGAACGNWSGLYGGLHAGYLWSNGKGEADAVPAVDAGLDPDGFSGGALLGGKYQIDCMVLGIEGDIGFGDMKGSDKNVGVPGPAGLLGADAEVNWNAHIRARLGYAAGEVLPFIAGGLAVADIDVGSALGGDNNVHYGWTLGGGIDWAVSPQLIIRAEYLYDNYGEKTYAIGPVDVDGDIDAHTVRAAVIWNFGGL